MTYPEYEAVIRQTVLDYGRAFRWSKAMREAAATIIAKIAVEKIEIREAREVGAA